MSESTRLTSHELMNYLIQLGNHVNELYAKLDTLESRLDDHTHSLTELQRAFDAVKRETIEFLVESIKQLPTVNTWALPPLPDLTDPGV